MPNEQMYEQIIIFIQTHILLISIIVLFLVILGIFTIIGLWKIFEKAGENGWKCLIPIYNMYIMYKLFWETKYFWIMLALSICYSMINNVAIRMQLPSLTLISVLIYIASFIFTIIFNYRFASSFGHGVLYCVGLTILAPIFYIVIGFSQDEYYEY